MASLSALIELRLSRRSFIRGAAAAGAIAAFEGYGAAFAAAAPSASTLKFRGLKQVVTERDAVAKGYEAVRLISWGDALLPGAASFDPGRLSAQDQARRFGYNNDFLAYFPLPRGSLASTHGLLVVNHEYPNPELMFPNWSEGIRTAEHTAVEQAALGLSVVEIKRMGDGWQVVKDSPYARRVTLTTPCRIAGPAAGAKRLRTSADRKGRLVLGTLGNCAGGVTPWQTALSGEENVQFYFGGADPATLPEAESLKVMTVTASGRNGWHKFDPRFNLAREPREINRFGWIVEIDPYDPAAEPVKRTALGRFKHEGATCVLNADGRVVVYMGDDEADEFLYRFVTRDSFDPNDPDAHDSLLDSGTLSVARFDEEGLSWIPLVHGEGPLTKKGGFASQADILIDTRLAARAVGATPMDRPEDVEVNPVSSLVYVMLTNSKERETVNPANPRPKNRHGHILELKPPTAANGRPDHAAQRFAWDIFMLCGKPDTTDGGRYGVGTEAWLSSPDNCTFDRAGRLWIATDQGTAQAKNMIPDGLYACDTAGEGRAALKLFYAVPRGAECCGPCFTPDGETLFVSVQHPGEGGFENGAYRSHFAAPSTRWPDFKPDMPPRPSVVAITRKKGGKIGS